MYCPLVCIYYKVCLNNIPLILKQGDHHSITRGGDEAGVLELDNIFISLSVCNTFFFFHTLPQVKIFFHFLKKCISTKLYHNLGLLWIWRLRKRAKGVITNLFGNVFKGLSNICLHHVQTISSVRK